MGETGVVGKYKTKKEINPGPQNISESSNSLTSIQSRLRSEINRLELFVNPNQLDELKKLSSELESFSTNYISTSNASAHTPTTNESSKDNRKNGISNSSDAQRGFQQDAVQFSIDMVIH